MIETILSTVLSSALIISSTFSTTPPTPQFVFTRVLPERNFVAHVVAKDETLKTIAQNFYKDEAYWTTIWNDNSWVKDSEQLESDLLLKIKAQKPDSPEELRPELNEKYAQQFGSNENMVNYYSALPVAIPTHSSTPAAAPTPYDSVYQQAGAKYGVPWQVLYGVHMTETGGRNGAISSGYGTGAQGPMQFMPGTWRTYGVDGDGDGVADINNAQDAIHSAANYLAKHGSLYDGLRAYGGNTNGTMAYARAKGYNQ